MPGFTTLPMVLTKSIMLKNLSLIVRLLSRLIQLIASLVNHQDLDEIIQKFKKALDLFIGLMEDHDQLSSPALFPAVPEVTAEPLLPFSDKNGKKYGFAEVMSQKEAYMRLGISESKIKLMRKDNEFTVLSKEGGDMLVKPTVWLLRTEVEAKRLSYSVPKGKV